jgi:hypothetical protein
VACIGLTAGFSEASDKIDSCVTLLPAPMFADVVMSSESFRVVVDVGCGKGCSLLKKIPILRSNPL